VKKELLESKKNFEDVWATNPQIRNLASLLFETSDEKVLESLVEAVIEVPYLALSTKKQIFESIDSALGISDYNNISTKEIKDYASKLFEMKKPLKSVVINLLNEKYGINVQNLKEVATFSSLANTQTVIFEALARLAPKGSVVKDSLSDMSKMLKTKNGVEVIDINDILQEAFDACGYSQFCEDFALSESISFENILDDDITMSDLLEGARERLLLDKDKEGKAKAAEKDETHPANDTEDEDDSVRAAKKNGKNAKSKKKAKSKDMDGDEDLDPSGGKTKLTKEEAEEEEVPPVEQPETMDDPEQGEHTEEEPPLTKEEFMEALADLDELMKGISSDEEEKETDEAETDELEA